MTIESSQPPRIDETHPTPLRDLVRTERMHGPSAEAFARLSKRLVSATEAAPCSSPSLLIHKIGVVAIVMAGGVLLTRSMTQRTTEVSATVAATTTTASPAPVEAPVANAQELAPVSVDELPAALPPVPARAQKLAAAPPSASSKGSLPDEAELELLQRAQAALPLDAGRAFDITREHARAYPNGEFVQEREVVAVEALARLGRHDEASQRADDLLRRFPRTPYTARLGAALGRPLSRSAVEGRRTTPAQ